MARDKGYGSGKPLTANASRTRQRVAATRFTKGRKNPIDNLVLGVPNELQPKAAASKSYRPSGAKPKKRGQ